VEAPGAAAESATSAESETSAVLEPPAEPAKAVEPESVPAVAFAEPEQAVEPESVPAVAFAEPVTVPATPEPVAAAAAKPEPAAIPAARKRTKAPAKREPAVARTEPATTTLEPVAATPEPVAAAATPEPVVLSAAAIEVPDTATITDPAVAEPVDQAPSRLDTVPAQRQATPDAVAKSDNLTRIPGIGPKMALALKAAGITSFAALAASDEAAIRAAISAAGLRFSPSLATWPEQAKLLADAG
jgi:predicted flap endonuclease-1-like 5' DNA nuclease